MFDIQPVYLLVVIGVMLLVTILLTLRLRKLKSDCLFAEDKHDMAVEAMRVAHEKHEVECMTLNSKLKGLKLEIRALKDISTATTMAREESHVELIKDAIKSLNEEFGKAHYISSRVAILRLRNRLIESVHSRSYAQLNDDQRIEILYSLKNDEKLYLTSCHIANRLKDTELVFVPLLVIE